MAINSYFFNAVLSDGVYDRIYNAEDVTSYLDLLVGNGVFPNPSTNLQVRASTGMNVIVGAGAGWINGHKMVNTADLTLAIDAADVVLNRIDNVIFFVDLTTRTMGIEVLKGTAASTPVAPTLTRTANRYEMCLAQIAVNKQTAAITATMITDTRGNSDLCGFVQGLIQQLDTTTLFQQWQAGFDDWFDEVKDELSTATLLRKFEGNYVTVTANESVFNVQTYVPQYAYALDVLEVRINGLTLTTNEYTRVGNVVTLVTPISEVGTPISFTVYKSVDGSDAETIIDEVADLQTVVNTLETGMYIATGDNDLYKLSQIVTAFIDGSNNDYKQLEIDVYGDLNCTSPAYSSNNVAFWFTIGDDGNANTRRVKLNFEHASRIVIDGSDYATNVLFAAENKNIEIENLQAVINNAGAARLFDDNTNATVKDSAFWLTGTGNLVGAYQGTFERCRLSVTGTTGTVYGFSANGGILRLNDCEILAYNTSSASNEAVAVQVQANQTNNVLIMNGCNCPIRSRSGYKQDNAVKINSGYYALTGNILGMAAAKYSTGDGKTETGTMIVSK